MAEQRRVMGSAGSSTVMALFGITVNGQDIDQSSSVIQTKVTRSSCFRISQQRILPPFFEVSTRFTTLQPIEGYPDRRDNETMTSDFVCGLRFLSQPIGKFSLRYRSLQIGSSRTLPLSWQDARLGERRFPWPRRILTRLDI